MLKKLCLSLILLLIIGLMLPQRAFYPPFLNGDQNYILCDGHMGAAWYIDKSSLQIERSEYPIYIVSINLVTAESAVGDVQDFYHGGAGKITHVSRVCFYYNWLSRTMYVKQKNGWRYLRPVGSWGETGIFTPAGKKAFALAFKKEFAIDEERRK